MRLTVAVVEISVLDRIAAVDHHVIADIDTDMACTGRVIGSLEENQIAGLHIGG